MRHLVGAGLIGFLLVLAGCSSGSQVQGSVGPSVDAGNPKTDAGSPAADAGTPDAGHPVPDAGSPAPDAGSPPPDGGAPDAGPPSDGGPLTLNATVVQAPGGGWQILNTGSGRTNDASLDEGGNLWVAAGPNGLLLKRAGASGFQTLTLADGLHPYGFPDQGSVTQVNLDVLSVAGGQAGHAYVGYNGIGDCEDEWDQNSANPDPNIYKSGDADHVWLNGGGVSVAHYDIYTGPGIVASEERGREKICSIYRIVYDGLHNNVWVGANHGYAYLNPNYTGNPMLLGEDNNQSLVEHAHPAINGYLRDASPATSEVFLTGGYYGLTTAPNGDLWVGGIFRTFHCANPGSEGQNFWACEAEDQVAKNQLDIWPDPLTHDAHPSQRVDDYVTGLAVVADGSVWASARNRAIDATGPQEVGSGLAHLSAQGRVMAYLNQGFTDPHLTALAADPSDGSLWVGSEQGLMRYQPATSTIQHFGANALGSAATDTVSNIQIQGTDGSRVVVVAFHSGRVGVYAGP